MLRNQPQSDYTSDFHVIMHNSCCYQLFPVCVSIYADGKMLQSNWRCHQKQSLHCAVHAWLHIRSWSKLQSSEWQKHTIHRLYNYVHSATATFVCAALTARPNIFAANWHTETSAYKIRTLALHVAQLAFRSKSRNKTSIHVKHRLVLLAQHILYGSLKVALFCGTFCWIKQSNSAGGVKTY